MWERLARLGPDGRAIWVFQVVAVVVCTSQIILGSEINLHHPIGGPAVVATLLFAVVGLGSGWAGRAAEFFRFTLLAQFAATIQFATIAGSAAKYWAWAMSTGDSSVEASATALLGWNAVVFATTTIVGLVCVNGLTRRVAPQRVAGQLV
ncbi:MAG: hypothetical protein ACJAYU_002551 [Bradymonadia bacterium]|jgi:hypothetical protein